MANKSVKFCVVDAFTDSAFKGNPAAVCLLEEVRDEDWMQSVAREFNLSETCFLTRLPQPAESTIVSVPRFRLRWFTPVAEVKLCGHATLAASHFLFTYDLESNMIEFSTLSGILTAKRVLDNKLAESSNSPSEFAPNSFPVELDFPVDEIMEYDGADEVSTISKSLNGASVSEMWRTTGEDLLVKLCGHATLAASHFLFTYDLESNMIEFSTLSGILTAKRVLDNKLAESSNSPSEFAPNSFPVELDFPVDEIMEYDGADEVSTISKSLNGASVSEMWRTTGEDLLVKLCGHATLAASHFLFTYDLESNMIEFSTLSGILTAKRVLDNKLAESSNSPSEFAPNSFPVELDFPVDEIMEYDGADEVSTISKSLNGASVSEMWRTTGEDLLVKLCGHATLAASHFLFTYDLESNMIEFSTLSGILTAKRVLDNKLAESSNSPSEFAPNSFPVELDFPVDEIMEYDGADEVSTISKSLNGDSVSEMWRTTGEDLLVKLCGHATLAASHFLFTYDLESNMIEFSTLSGILTAKRVLDNKLAESSNSPSEFAPNSFPVELDFPVDEIMEYDGADEVSTISKSLNGASVSEMWRTTGEDLLVKLCGHATLAASHFLFTYDLESNMIEFSTLSGILTAKRVLDNKLAESSNSPSEFAPNSFPVELDFPVDEIMEYDGADEVSTISKSLNGASVSEIWRTTGEDLLVKLCGHATLAASHFLFTYDLESNMIEFSTLSGILTAKRVLDNKLAESSNSPSEFAPNSFPVELDFPVDEIMEYDGADEVSTISKSLNGASVSEMWRTTGEDLLVKLCGHATLAASHFLFTYDLESNMIEFSTLSGILTAKRVLDNKLAESSNSPSEFAPNSFPVELDFPVDEIMEYDGADEVSTISKSLNGASVSEMWRTTGEDLLVKLCGHATLAASHFLFTYDLESNMIEFSTLSGILTAKRVLDNKLAESSNSPSEFAPNSFPVELDFPVDEIMEYDGADEVSTISKSLNGASVSEIWRTTGEDLLVKLCGHATLAASHFLFTYDLESNMIEFSTLSGILTAKRVLDNKLAESSNSPSEFAPNSFPVELDFPVDEIMEYDGADEVSTISKSLNGASVSEMWRTTGEDLLVKLCGHATLAASHFLFTYDLESNMIEFSTLSGILTAKRVLDNKLAESSNSPSEFAPNSFPVELDFPVDEIMEYDGADEVSTISKSLNGASVSEMWRTTGEDLLVKLCGHATLAASHFLFTYDLESNMIEFSTLSGILTAKRVLDNKLAESSNSPSEFAPNSFPVELDFPVDEIMEYDGADEVSTISKSLNGASVSEMWRTTGEDLLVKLCGHATLAASHFLFTYDLESNMIEFSTLSGILTAKRVLDNKLAESSNSPSEFAPNSFPVELDFPVDEIMEYDGADEVSTISKSLNGASVSEIWRTTGEDLLVVLPSGEGVVEAEPNFDEMRKIPGRGIIITGPATMVSGFDFFSRFFCPKLGVDEDPVCGSAHCALAAYWSRKLVKCDLTAFQASRRSGVLNLHIDETSHRVLLRGKAVVVMEGSLLV